MVSIISDESLCIMKKKVLLDGCSKALSKALDEFKFKYSALSKNTIFKFKYFPLCRHRKGHF